MDFVIKETVEEVITKEVTRKVTPKIEFYNGESCCDIIINDKFVMTINNDGTFSRIGCAGSKGVQTDERGRILEK